MSLLRHAVRTTVALALMGAVHAASASIVITEVDPYGSNSSDGYSADWFEVTNTGSTAVNISGWSMLDNNAASNTTTPYASSATISIGNLSSTKDKAFGSALLTLVGSSQSIGAGQSAIFLESTASASSSAALISSFESAWFGSSVPSDLLIGTYNDGTGALYGLSQTADMVNIFSGSSSSSSLVASVAFGADSGTPVGTFDNTVGANNTTLTTKSATGVNGAFVSASGLEIGSPGVDTSVVPLPAAAWLFASGLGGLGALVRRRQAA